MARIIVRGSAAVFRDGKEVSDPAVLRTLAPVIYDDERFTDYLGGTPEEDKLASVLVPGGILRFDYQEGASQLSVETEYQTQRPMTSDEVRLLVEYTLGQWSDGIGENWTCESSHRCGYTIMCLTPGDDVGPEYPELRIVDS